MPWLMQSTSVTAVRSDPVNPWRESTALRLSPAFKYSLTISIQVGHCVAGSPRSSLLRPSLMWPMAVARFSAPAATVGPRLGEGG